MKFPTKSLTVFLKVFLLGIFLLPVRWVPGNDDARPLPEIFIPNSLRVPVPPFLNVQIDGGYYSGILIDSSGYILVERKEPLPWDRYSFVQMEENQRISSQYIFSKKGLRLSWFRVHPDAVKNIRPYPWASPDPDGQVVSVGESVMVQCLARRKETLESAAANISKVTDTSFRLEFDSDPLLPENINTINTHGFCSVLNVNQELVGMLQRQLFSKKKYLTINTPRIQELMEKARSVASERHLPSPETFSPPEINTIPKEVFEILPDVNPADSLYHLQREGFKLEFITPPVVKALQEKGEPWARDKGKGKKKTFQVYHPEKGFFYWNMHTFWPKDVVIIQVIPDVHITAGSVSEIMGGIILAPLSCGQSLEGLDRRYHFSPEFLGMILLRDGVEIPPARPRRNCGNRQVKKVNAEGNAYWKDWVAGCYGAYQYDADSFQTEGSSYSVQIFSKNTDEPLTIPLSPEVVTRIQNDLSPFFKN